MELKDLIGLHKLSGVSFDTQPADGDTANVCNFVLDGKVYTAIEDPSDGYRSSMREIMQSKRDVKNKWAPVRVMCIYRNSGRNYSVCDLLEIVDVVTGKIVLTVGTDNTDDYYPSFVSDFCPENMIINQVKK